MHRVLLERQAENDLQALQRPLYKRIIERLLSLRQEPRPNGVKKLTGMRNAWRIREGDWRILYEISDANKEIKVYRIRHRNRAY